MKKRIASCFVAFCLLLTMLPMSVFAAGGNGISVSKTTVAQGDSFTVSLEIPAISDPLSNIEFNISFDNAAFEVVEFTLPAFAAMNNTANEANAAGRITCSNASSTGENDLTVLQSGGVMSATFKVKETATNGAYDFTVSKYTVDALDEITYVDVDKSPAGVVKKATITVTDPSQGGGDGDDPATDTGYEVYYQILGTTTDADGDKFVEVEPGATVDVGVFVKSTDANAKKVQAFDIYPTWNENLTYASVAGFNGVVIEDGEMSKANPHFYSVAKKLNLDITNEGVQIATLKLTLGTDITVDTHYPVYFTSATNLAKEAYAESVPVTVDTTGEMGVETKKQVTVSFDTKGGSEVAAQTINYNTVATEPATDPTKTGYTFGGWFADSACNNAFDFTQNIKANTTVYAKWNVDSYTVTFDTKGGTTVDAQTVKYNEKASKPADPTMTGYTFGGWFANADCTTAFNFDTLITDNTTIYAKWTVNQYTITFNVDGGTAIDPIKRDYGTAITAPADPAKTGYTFKGWDKEIPATMPAGDMTITAQWTANTYSVKYNANTGAGTMANSTHTYDADEALTANAFTKTGYTFTGWNTQADGNGTDYTNSAIVKNLASAQGAEVILYAQWAPITYTVQFNPGDGGSGTMAPQTFTYDVEQALTANAFTAPANHVFNGWKNLATGATYSNGQSVKNLTTENGGTVTLTAQWAQNVFAITYDYNGVVNTVKMPETFSNSAVVKIPDAAATGYTFLGWTSEALNITSATKNVEIPAGTSTAVDLTANWQINQYTITFNTDGGSAVAPITQNYGTGITAPAAPTKEGYTFAGWNPAVPATMPAENLTITAQWTVNQYTITFDADGGTAVAPITQDYGTAITAPAAPAKTGYTFAGWTPAVPATMPAANMTVKANWTEHKYNIDFNFDGVEDENNVPYSEAIQLPSAEQVTNPGYVLTGWTDGTNTYNPGATVDKLTAVNGGTVALNPVWEAAEYTVSFDLGAHSAATTAPDSIKVIYNSSYPALPAGQPANGYSFQGWYIGDAQIKEGDTVAITADTKLVAKYAPISYTITFKLNGGAWAVDGTAMTMTYNIESDATLPVAVKQLQKFKVWNVSDANGSWQNGTIVNEATALKGAYGNVTLTAQWEAAFNYAVESYKYAYTGYVMLRIATDSNENAYTFDGKAMYYTDDANYKLGEKAVFVTLIPTTYVETVESKNVLTAAGLDLLKTSDAAATAIVRNGMVNKDTAVNIADANAVYQMVENGGGYYGQDQLETLHRLQADVNTAPVTGAYNNEFRGSIADVNAIVNAINSAANANG